VRGSAQEDADTKAGPQIIPDTEDAADQQTPRGDDSESHQDKRAGEPKESGHSPGETQTDRDHEHERRD
jgi:hypothetical protein